jgi:hypothetical protein
VGLSCEAFGHLEGALESYRLGWPDAVSESETFRQTAFGIVRTLGYLGRIEEARAAAAKMAEAAPTRRDRDFVEELRSRIR